MGHSGSVRHSYCLHRIYGSGSGLYPGGQEHTALWFLAEQSAFTPHRSNGHGSTHSRLRQVWVNGHSESLLQPARCKKKHALIQDSFQEYVKLNGFSRRRSYVLHICCMDLQHSPHGKHRLLDDCLLCIQHSDHILLWSMDLDIFLEYMQDGLDTQGQTCIQVWVLKIRLLLMLLPCKLHNSWIKSFYCKIYFCPNTLFLFVSYPFNIVIIFILYNNLKYLKNIFYILWRQLVIKDAF